MGMFDFGSKKPIKDKTIEKVENKDESYEKDEKEYEINYSSSKPKSNRELELERRKEEEEKKKNKDKVKKEQEKYQKDNKENDNYEGIPESEDSKMGEQVESVLLESVLGPHIVNPDVTDISFNGWDLYVQDSYGLHKVEDSGITGKDIQNIGRQIANISNKNFTNTEPILDTAIGRYRLNFMHSAVSPFGATTAIRVSKPSLAIKDVSKLANGSVIQFLNLCMKVGENLIISGQTGSGKSTSVSEVVDTTEGRKTMGDIKVGDYVYDRLGKPTKVLGVYPQGKLDVYEVELQDGRTVKASEDHIWSVISSKGNLVNKTTKELMGDLYWKHMRESCKKHYIPMNGAIEKTEKDFKVHPYVMGALLGDGCLTNKSLTLSSEDDWIPNKVAKLIGSPEVKPSKGSYSWSFRLPKEKVEEIKRTPGRHSIKNFQTTMILDESLVGLCDTRYIPEEYFEGSIEQRYELLQGLMDTDGGISGIEYKRYNVKFTTSSEQLSKDVLRLGRSLGFKMSYRDKTRKREGRKESREINVNFLVPNEIKHKLFSLPRKVERGLECKEIKKKARYDRIGISEITKLDYQEEMVCIRVDNDESLFQVGENVITHNTEFVRHVSI